MRLEGLEIFFVAPPPPGWGGRYWTIVRLTAEDGTQGWGECYLTGVGHAAARAVVEDVFRRHMQGESVENVELMFRRAYSSGFTGRPDPTVIGAFSGLEIACWDIVGKARGRPVWALLGGRVNQRLRSYSYLYPLAHHDDRFWTSPEMTAESAAAMVDQGFTAVKFDPAGPYTIRGGHMPAMTDITRSAAFCAAIRETVLDRADLLFGTHGQFSVGGAIRLAQAIEKYQPLWYEEPVPPDDVAGMARVARSTRIPVATGERLTTKAEFAPILRQGAAAILQPATGRCGGLWEGKKIAAMAEVHSAEVAPHLYAGPVEWAANVHLATTLPNVSMVETIGTCGGADGDRNGAFHGQMIRNAIRWDGGFILPPEAPGLGIELEEELLTTHAYDGDRLHLEMQEAPCDWRDGNDFRGGSAD